MDFLDLIVFFCPLQVPFFIPAPDGLPFVIFPFSFGQGQGNLCFSVDEIDPQGNQGKAPFIDFAIEPF